jgi:cytochrome P450
VRAAERRGGRRLVAYPVLIRNAVEESLRVTSPVVHMRRTAFDATMVGGAPVCAGQRLALFYGPANHDPRVFTEPRSYDVDRANARLNVAFGFGPHSCLGAPLARLEMRVFLEEFLARFPDYEIRSEPSCLRSDFVSGIKRLEVTLR